MIPVQDIVDRIASMLDAEGSDRYLFDQDYKPAINSAKDWVVAVFKKVFSQKAISEESLRELVVIRVFQTSNFSRIALEQASLGDEIWSILSVNPEPVTYPNQSILPSVNSYDSFFRNDLTYVESDFFAKRLSVEEWENMKNNIFMAGSTKLNNTFKNYSYLIQGDYSSTTYNPLAKEIEISPKIPNELVGVRYLKYPDNISLTSDFLEFPRSLFDLIVNKAANFISIKQGDNTNLYGVTQQDINLLIQLMT